MQNFTGQTILCTLSWNKVTYQNPGQEYDENLVCEDFLNMGMLPLEECKNQGMDHEQCLVEARKAGQAAVQQAINDGILGEDVD